MKILVFLSLASQMIDIRSPWIFWWEGAAEDRPAGPFREWSQNPREGDLGVAEADFWLTVVSCPVGTFCFFKNSFQGDCQDANTTADTQRHKDDG